MSSVCVGCLAVKLNCGIWPSLIISYPKKIGTLKSPAPEKKLEDILTPNDKYHISKSRIFIPVIRFWIPFSSTWLEQNKSRVMT